MPLESKLIALDERITSQFQKITDWGYKRLGWDKYDFAGRAFDLSSIALFGDGVYLVINGVTNRKPIMMMFGASVAFLGRYQFYDARKRMKGMREFEEVLLEDNNAPLPPRYYSSRPVMFTMFPPFIAGIASSYSTPVSYALFCSAAAIFFSGAASYFHNTTMYPPKKKKTFADALAWAKEKLTITKPAVEEAKVQI